MIHYQKSCAICGEHVAIHAVNYAFLDAELQKRGWHTPVCRGDDYLCPECLALESEVAV